MGNPPKRKSSHKFLLPFCHKAWEFQSERSCKRLRASRILGNSLALRSPWRPYRVRNALPFCTRALNLVRHKPVERALLSGRSTKTLTTIKTFAPRPSSKPQAWVQEEGLFLSQAQKRLCPANGNASSCKTWEYLAFHACFAPPCPSLPLLRFPNLLHTSSLLPLIHHVAQVCQERKKRCAL